MKKANRKGFIEIEKVKKSRTEDYFHYRTIASNGRQVGRQSEQVKRMASLIKSIKAECEIYNGKFPIRVKLINCTLPAKEYENFIVEY